MEEAQVDKLIIIHQNPAQDGADDADDDGTDKGGQEIFKETTRQTNRTTQPNRKQQHQRVNHQREKTQGDDVDGQGKQFYDWPNNGINQAEDNAHNNQTDDVAFKRKTRKYQAGYPDSDRIDNDA
jgi:hypothetical protein